MPRTSGTWIKGQGGKPKGARDHFPRSAKRVVEAMLEQFGTDPTVLRAAMLKGLMAKAGTSAPYCKMVIEHLKGAPDQHLDVASALARKVVDELHPGPSKAA